MRLFTVDILLLSGNKVLLQLRDNNPSIFWSGYWSMPGGAGENDETPIEAAKREFREETGYKLNEPTLIYKGQYKKPNGEKGDRYVFYEEYDDDQQIQCLEGRKMEFIPIVKFDALKIIPQEKKVLKELIKKDLL